MNLQAGIATEYIASLIPASKPQRKTRIAFFSVAISMHFDWQLAQKTNKEIAEMVRVLLPEDKYELVCADEPFEDHLALKAYLDSADNGQLDGIFLCHAAYTTGEVASQLGTWLAQRNIPIFSYAMPEPMGPKQNLSANRLCSQNFVLGILHSLDVKYQWMFATTDDPRVAKEITSFAKVARTIGSIKGRKALIAGAGRVPGFYDCEVSEIDVLRRFELGLDRINLIDITTRMADFKVSDIDEIKRLILEHKDCRFNNVPEKQIDDSIRLALALMVVAREGNYIGVSFKNWPEIFDHFNIAGDGAMALINDQGIVISDEADTGALITMVIFDQLTDKQCVPLLSDISYVAGDGKSLGVWHNGSAATKLRKAGAGFECRKHGILENYDSETAWGLVMEFLIAPGEVTVAKYQSPCIDNVLAFEGDLVESEMRFRGTYGEIIPHKYNASQIVGTILDRGLDHHWIIGRGHFLKDLNVLNYWLNIKDIPVSNTGGNIGMGSW